MSYTDRDAQTDAFWRRFIATVLAYAFLAGGGIVGLIAWGLISDDISSLANLYSAVFQPESWDKPRSTAFGDVFGYVVGAELGMPVAFFYIYAPLMRATGLLSGRWVEESWDGGRRGRRKRKRR